MQLISLDFFLLFAVTLLLYNLFVQRARWRVLLCSSLVFYLWAGLFAFVYMIIISLSSFFLALFLQRRKEGSKFALILPLYIGVAVTVGAWVALKLISRGGDVILPLGISFYSLRVISYLVDVKRGRAEAQRGFLRYLLFVCYFPVVLQGPIVRYKEISDSLFSGRRAGAEEGISGLLLMLWGIFKKVVVANTLAAPLSKIATESDKYRGGYVLMLLCLYSAEIYCDFSGGIDIVRGASGMLGIALPKNFDRPFASTTLREFWNRWHISLGEYFEHYVFYPLSLSRPMQKISRRARARLGGRRGRKIPLYIATMTTWLLTGLWHGFRWSFIAWGLINGGLVLLSLEFSPIAERFYARHPTLAANKALRQWLGRVRVFLIIGAVRLLDVYGSVILTFKMLGTVFYDLSSYGELERGMLSLISVPELLAVAMALVAIFIVSRLEVKSDELAKSPSRAVAAVFALALSSVVLGGYGMGFSAGDFIYSRF